MRRASPHEPPRSARRGVALMRAVRRDPLAVLTGLREDHGTLVRLRLPFMPVYLVSDPEAIRQALTRTHREYHKGISRRSDPAGPGIQPLSRILGEGLLISEAPLHRRQRRLLQPIFHRERIEQYAETFVALADGAARTWRDGVTRDVHRDLTELTLAIIARTVFDVDLDAAVITTIRTAVTEHQPALGRLASPVGRLLDRLPLPAKRRWQHAQGEIDALLFQLIADRKAASAGGVVGRDVLSLLVAVRDAETDEPMPDRQIRDEAMTLLLAGHETTANALAWSLHLLANDPPAQARLHAELDTVLNGRMPGGSDMPRLAYVSAVWREALRLFPPAWLVTRRLVREHWVSGSRLPAGSMLLLSPWVVHRDPRWWPEPDKFRPERWLAQPDRPRYAYFPFGGGPRQCIGNDFADLEGILALATILRRWRISPAPQAPPVSPEPLVTLRPRHGVTVIVTRR
jgi:cytochrome P450